MLKLLKLEGLEVRKVSEVTPNLLEGEKFSLTQPKQSGEKLCWWKWSYRSYNFLKVIIGRA